MIRTAALGLMLLAPIAAKAQGLDLSRGGAIDITAQGGVELRQSEQEVVAHGDARAVRGGVTVTADTLIGRYRKKAASPAAPLKTPGSPDASNAGANEVYRLEAIGHVRIFTATDLAIADKAVYDIDQAVLLLTGRAMSITTPQQVMTARDTMEYWSLKRMAIGRGLATVTTNDGRRMSADVLVAYTQAPDNGAVQNASQTSKKPDDLGSASGKLERVEAFGHVEIRTATETVKGDRGIYVADTGVARLGGHVQITRGQNQLQGDDAVVNMRTGISTLVNEPGKRVEGLVMPNDVHGSDGKEKGSASSTPASKP